MSLIGGSSSKTTNTTTTTTYNAAADGDNEGTIIGGSNNNVTVTDHGAVTAAFQNSQAAIEGMSDSTDAALEFGQELFNKSASTYDTSIQQLTSAQNAQQRSNERILNGIKGLAETKLTGGANDAMDSFKQLAIVMMLILSVAVVAIIGGRNGAFS